MTPEGERWWRAEKWRAFSAVGISYVTIVMAMTMSFIVLPAIADTFDVSLRAVGWVVIVEALVIAALLLPLGGLADNIGRRRVLVAGLVVFGIGSVLAGLAPSFALLIGARVVMSLGNAMVQSVGTGMIVAAFPPDERGRSIGAQAMAVALGAAAGPLLGGLALEIVSWEVLFVLVALPTAGAIVSVYAYVVDDTPARGAERPELDVGGSVLSALTMVLAVVTIGNPFAVAWSSPLTTGSAVATVILAGAFIRWELDQKSPMFELRLFTVSAFRNAALMRVLGFVGATVTTFLLPIYLVTIRGLSEATAGGMVFLIAVGMGVSGQIAGQLYDRVDARAPTIFGLTVQALTALAFTQVSESTSVVLLGLIVLGHGLGSGFWIVPNNGAMLGAVPATSLGVGGAFTNVTRTLGSVLGQAAAAAIVVGVMASRGLDVPLADIAETTGANTAFLDGWSAAYMAVIGLALLTMVLATRLPGRAARR